MACCAALTQLKHILLHDACGYRSVIMAGAVQQTSHTFNWFFLFYRFVVGVLFAELMVGILIATFGKASRTDTSAAGEILHQFSFQLEVMPLGEQLAFVKGLGKLAKTCLEASLESQELDIFQSDSVAIGQRHVEEIAPAPCPTSPLQLASAR